MLFYQKFRGDLESIGFKFNTYDPCIANRTVVGRQHTVRFHVDDVMSSHLCPKVNDKFRNWLNKTYGVHGEVKATKGKIHEFLGMTFDFTVKGKVTVKMLEYVIKMIEDSPFKLGKLDTYPTPAVPNLFEKGSGKLLNTKRRASFHTTVTKGIFVSKRARPDIHQAVAILSTQVKEPNESDWHKL